MCRKSFGIVHLGMNIFSNVNPKLFFIVFGSFLGTSLKNLNESIFHSAWVLFGRVSKLLCRNIFKLDFEVSRVG